MQSGKFGLGILAGLMLGLVVIGSAGFSSGPFGSFVSSPGLNQIGAGSITSTRTAGTDSSTPSPPYQYTNSTASTVPGGSSETQTDKGVQSAGFSPLSSRLDSIARQPIATTGFVLLPIFAAFLFGLVLYGASKARNKGEGDTES